MRHQRFVLWASVSGLGIFHAVSALAQCAPGIPSAGNPACIPPDAPSSPYYQQQQQAPQPPPVRWSDRWGALVSDDALGKLGVASERLNEANAWQTAEADCYAKGGVNCIRLVSYRNQCVAMVAGATSYSFSVGPTTNDAIRDATEKCKASTTNCHTYYVDCSAPVRIQ